MMTHKPFAEMLRAARQHRDFTPEHLSQASGVDRTAISHFERGARDPSVDTLRKLAIALDVTADYLLGLTEDTRRIGA